MPFDALGLFARQLKELEEQRQRMLDRRRPRFSDDEQEEVPLRYLKEIFVGRFLPLTHNHIGVYYTHKKGVSKRWVGLQNPPIFYMFDRIRIEDYSRYIPSQTTEDRWIDFLEEFRQPEEDAPPPKDYSFQQVLHTLKNNGYIEHLQVEGGRNIKTLTDSVENAARKYLVDTEAAEEEKIKRLFDDERYAELKEKMIEEFGNAICSKHAANHMMSSYVLTDAFFTACRAFKEESGSDSS